MEFPELSDDFLRTLWELNKNKDRIIKSGYPKWVIEIFRKDDKEDGKNRKNREYNDLEEETKELYSKLKEEGNKLLEVEDVSERMSYFRTHTALLEKLLTIRERAANSKAMGEFVSAVLSIFDSVLSEEQKKEFMDSLKKKVDTMGFNKQEKI